MIYLNAKSKKLLFKRYKENFEECKYGTLLQCNIDSHAFSKENRNKRIYPARCTTAVEIHPVYPGRLET